MLNGVLQELSVYVTIEELRQVAKETRLNMLHNN
jgi:hypothetical protein